MNLIALTSPEPGIRYRAHLWALQELGIEIQFVQVAGLGVIGSKVSRQLSLLRKKGPGGYFSWRARRRQAAGTRLEVGREIELRFADRPFSHAPIPVSRSFSGFSKDLADYIVGRNPSFILQCGAWLLPEGFINSVPPVLNLHPGILPGIRGLDPVFWSLYYGREDWLGSTLHVIDAGIDTGKPLMRRTLKRLEDDSMVDLIERQIDMEMELLRLFFTHLPDGYEAFDEGGLEKSVYKSSWTREQYEALKAADWWGPNMDRTPAPKNSPIAPPARSRPADSSDARR